MGVSAMNGSARADNPEPSAPPYSADAADPSVVSLASDRKISIAEAQQRIGWQDPARRLSDQLALDLGSRFGGVWIDNADGDRIKIGIAADRTAADVTTSVNAALDQWKLTTVSDTVAVAFGIDELQAINAELGSAALEANNGAEVDLATNLRVAENRVGLLVPSVGKLTTQQQAVVDLAKQKYPAQVRILSWSGKIIEQSATAGPAPANAALTDPECFPPGPVGSACFPPIRGGLALFPAAVTGRWRRVHLGVCS